MYFVFSTGDKIKIFTSSSLEGYVSCQPAGLPSLADVQSSPWLSSGVVLTNGTKIPLEGRGYWAPDVNFVNGNYVLYYSLSSSGNQTSTTGVATSPSMESGSWQDHGEVIMSHDGQQYNASTCTIWRYSSPRC